MKTKDIKPGKKYLVHVSEEDSLVYGGTDLEATVIRAGFHYEVTRVRGSMIRGAPFYDTKLSEYPNGVEVEWEKQEVWSNQRGRKKENAPAGRAIINARQVEFELSESEES